MIHTDIPFYPNIATEKWPEGVYCVPVSYKMILGVLMPEREFTMEELEKITGKHADGGAFATHGLIWLADHGFEVQHWDTHDWRVFEKEGLEYIRRVIGEEAAEHTARGSDIPFEQSVVDEFLRKVTIVKKKPTTDDIKRLVEDGWIIRAPVNSRKLNKREGYMGHSVVVLGFEGDEIIFHDSGLPPVPSRREKCDFFQEAMDSFGGEIDAIRKKS